mmetsp:Transcript_38041/g.120893  ORF Transcript_38041/g.120893 Transcript_38041/m.120893 type:complete len:244 (+) Transcript_38041:1057-1788(+)
MAGRGCRDRPLKGHAAGACSSCSLWRRSMRLRCLRSSALQLRRGCRAAGGRCEAWPLGLHGTVACKRCGLWGRSLAVRGVQACGGHGPDLWARGPRIAWRPGGWSRRASVGAHHAVVRGVRGPLRWLGRRRGAVRPVGCTPSAWLAKAGGGPAHVGLRAGMGDLPRRRCSGGHSSRFGRAMSLARRSTCALVQWPSTTQSPPWSGCRRCRRLQGRGRGGLCGRGGRCGRRGRGRRGRGRRSRG